MKVKIIGFDDNNMVIPGYPVYIDNAKGTIISDTFYGYSTGGIDIKFTGRVAEPFDTEKEVISWDEW